MTTSFKPLTIRALLGSVRWERPTPYGPDGWRFACREEPGSVLVSCAYHHDAEWVHASVSYRLRMPTYDDLAMLHKAVFRDGWSYQVFAPPAEHVNIHATTLHLWGRLDGKPALPNFGDAGTI